VRVVDDPVDDGNWHLVFREELAPVGKVLVRGQHDRAVLLEAVHELEEVVARLPAHRQVAELINDQQIEPAELSNLSFELAFHLRKLKLLDELECSCKHRTRKTFGDSNGRCQHLSAKIDNGLFSARSPH